MPHQHFVVYKKHWKKRNKSVWIFLKQQGFFEKVIYKRNIA